MQSPDPSSKKENQRKSKKESKSNKSAAGGGGLLGDLPGLGGGKFSQEHSGFDDFDFDDNSPPPQKQAKQGKGGGGGSKGRDKFSAAQAALDDFEKEEQEGFKISNHPANSASNKFKVNVYGIPQAHEQQSDDIEEEDYIEEEIQTDREVQHLAEPVQAITVSQSFGVDPSVDSLALDDYDHIEPVD